MMKKILCLAIFVVLLYTGFQYLQAFRQFSNLSSRVDLIVSDPRSYTPETMRKFVVSEASELEIPLSKSDIEIAIKRTDRKSLAQTRVERPGIEMESKLLLIHFHYPVEICGITRTFSYTREKVFTSKASLANRYGGLE